jgi:hypothetical protein
MLSDFALQKTDFVLLDIHRPKQWLQEQNVEQQSELGMQRACERPCQMYIVNYNFGIY